MGIEDMICVGVPDGCYGCDACKSFNAYSVEYTMKLAAMTTPETVLYEERCANAICNHCGKCFYRNVYYDVDVLRCIRCKKKVELDVAAAATTTTAVSTGSTATNAATAAARNSTVPTGSVMPPWRTAETRASVKRNEMDPFSPVTMSKQNTDVSVSKTQSQLQAKRGFRDKIPAIVGRNPGTQVGTQAGASTGINRLANTTKAAKALAAASKKTAARLAAATAKAAAFPPAVASPTVTTISHKVTTTPTATPLTALAQTAAEEATADPSQGLYAETKPTKTAAKKRTSSQRKSPAARAANDAKVIENLVAMGQKQFADLFSNKILVPEYVMHLDELYSEMTQEELERRNVPQWHEMLKDEKSDYLTQCWYDEFDSLWRCYAPSCKSQKEKASEKVAKVIPVLIYMVALNLGYAWNCREYARIVASGVTEADAPTTDPSLLTEQYKKVRKGLRTAKRELKYPMVMLAKGYVSYILNLVMGDDPRVKTIAQTCRDRLDKWCLEPYNIIYKLFTLGKKAVDPTSAESTMDTTPVDRMNEQLMQVMEGATTAAAAATAVAGDAPPGSEEKPSEQKSGKGRKKKAKVPGKRNEAVQKAKYSNFEWTVPALCVCFLVLKEMNVGRDVDGIFKTEEFADSVEVKYKKFEQAKSFLEQYVKTVPAP